MNQEPVDIIKLINADSIGKSIHPQRFQPVWGQMIDLHVCIKGMATILYIGSWMMKARMANILFVVM